MPGRKFERYQMLRQTYLDFKRDFETCFPDISIDIDRRALFNAVHSFFHDIKRVQDFHDIKMKDDIKRAAYTVKWLLKTRPIHCANPTLDKTANTDKMLFANEIFAMWTALALLEWPARIIPHEIWKVCYYTLHYRTFDVDMFMLFLLALRANMPGTAACSAMVENAATD